MNLGTREVIPAKHWFAILLEVREVTEATICSLL
jgi:hypothetical protein